MGYPPPPRPCHHHGSSFPLLAAIIRRRVRGVLVDETLLSVGHGFSARALGSRLIADGWSVVGTTRSEAKFDELRAEGVSPLLWPGDDLPLDQVTHLLISVPPGPKGDPVLRASAEAIRRATHLRWIGYLSTTGVYGDHAGAWVDEDTALSPSTQRGQARVDAEAAWMALGVPVHIFRLAGIYGPGRGPFAKVRNGTARRIIKEGQVFSRIHVDDIAAVVHASIKRPNPGRVYNVCDDDPAPPQDVIAHAATLLGLPPPPEVYYEQADMSDMARSFYAESKRVRNNRIKDELQVTLKYPDYKTGLAALLAAEAS